MKKRKSGDRKSRFPSVDPEIGKIVTTWLIRDLACISQMSPQGDEQLWKKGRRPANPAAKPSQLISRILMPISQGCR